MCYRLPHRRSAPESCWQSTARHPPRPPNSCFPARRARGIRSKLGATNSIEQYHLVLSRPRCCKPIELRPRSHHWPRVDSRGWLLSQGHDDDMSTQPCSYRWVRSAGGGRTSVAESAIDPERSDAEGAALIRTSSALHRAFRSAPKRHATCASLCAGSMDCLARRRQRVRAGGTQLWRALVNGLAPIAGSTTGRLTSPWDP